MNLFKLKTYKSEKKRSRFSEATARPLRFRVECTLHIFKNPIAKELNSYLWIVWSNILPDSDAFAQSLLAKQRSRGIPLDYYRFLFEIILKNN